MKTTAIIALTTVALAAATTAFASEKAKDSKGTAAASKQNAKANQVQAPQKESNVTLTGSYIKRDVRRNGMITDGPGQVIVLDSQAIRNSGASDLNDLLIRRGLRR